MIFIIYISVFLFGCTTGLIIAIVTYPRREVKNLYRSFIDEGKQMGELKHFRDIVDHNVKIIVKPNCETLYSTTFIDLIKNNYLLKIPQTSEHFSVCFLNSNTDTIGYITNKNLLPHESTEFILSKNIKSINKSENLISLNTDMCWIIIRYGIPSSKPIEEVHSLQNGIILTSITNKH